MRKVWLYMLCLLSSLTLWADDNYLCFTAQIANSSVKLSKYKEPPTISLEYSFNKTDWFPYTINSPISLTNVGDKVYLRATSLNSLFSAMDAGGTRYYYFSLTGWLNASGNIMSLLDKNCEQTSLPNAAFVCLFQSCQSLLTAPELPATMLSTNCYRNMFSACSNLKTAPRLPATIMQKKCYYSMFGQCSALSNPPALPATQLADSCYMNMFLQCTQLQHAPYLPATDISYKDSYAKMFQNCSTLDSIHVAFSEWKDATNKWLDGVHATGVLKAPCELPKDERSSSKIPANWRFRCGKDTVWNEFSAVECDSFTWNNQTYYQSGDYQQTFPTRLIDDSIVTLHLTILPSTTGDTTASACSSFSWYNQTYTASGNYTHHLTNHYGCDSTLTLHLTIFQPSSGDTTASACSSFSWYNQIYTASGDYTHHLLNHYGCDSTLTLHLTIFQPSSDDTTASACSSFSWYNQTYTASGDYTHHILNHYGCDSTLTLHLTIFQPKHTSLSDTICQGDTLIFNNQPLTASGLYRDTLPSIEGCDSVVEMNLTVINKPTASFHIDEACADDKTVELIFDSPVQPNTLYQLLFDSLALSNGFQSHSLRPLTTSSISIPLPQPGYPLYLTPNTYSAQLALSDPICSTPTTYPVRFTVHYPSSIIFTKWDDIIGVTNKGYNGGYEFSAYQWYYNDQPVPNATADILYIEGGLPEGTYQVLLTRQSDGVSLLTCPYTLQVAKKAPANYSAQITSVSPHSFTLNCNMPTTYRLLNALGQYIANGTASEGVNTISLPSHLTVGMCIVQCESNEGSVITVKLIAQ